MTPTGVQDLLVTDRFLVKGRLRDKNRRLSQVLESRDRSQVMVEEAILVDLADHSSLEVPQVLVNLERLFLAHEFLDLAGDCFWQGAAEGRDLLRVRVHTATPHQLTLTGLTGAGDLEANPDRKRYLVLQDITVTGPQVESGGDLAILCRLPYVILRRQALACIYAVAPR